MKATVKMHGLKEVLKSLDRLGLDVKNTVLNEAVGKGAWILRDQAQKNCYIAPAPYEVVFNGKRVTMQPASLRDSIIMKRMPKEEIGGMSAVYKITTKQIDPNNANIGKIANMIEYGGNVRGFPAGGHPFMRPAVQSHGNQAIAKTTKHLTSEIKRIWKRV